MTTFQAACRRSIALALLVAVFLAAGCHGSQNGPAKTVVRITPEELFTGDLKRLQPHLGLTTGYVKLACDGPGVPAEIAIEIWKNGKLLRHHGGSSGLLPDEISISVKEVADRDGKDKYRVVIAEKAVRRELRWNYGVLPHIVTSGGSSSLTTDVDVPRLSEESSLRAVEILKEPIELTKDHPVVIWAYVAGRHAGETKPGETIEEAVSRVEWALVVKMSLREEI
jgi:hypothetical protein